ncbi:MAG: DUF2061 domain-containing protein [Acidobacteriia bacterium]|nr:DUF2061 domain-containing protein [Terriglobia bacterium]
MQPKSSVKLSIIRYRQPPRGITARYNHLNSYRQKGDFVESHQRSIAKAASYRLLGSLLTALIAYLLCGAWDVALGVGLFDSGAKMAAYFLHERLWARIKWGAPRPTDYQI